MTPKKANKAPIPPSPVHVYLDRICWALAAVVFIELTVVGCIHVAQLTEQHARTLGLPVTDHTAEQLADVTE